MGSPSLRILGPLEVDGAAALRGPKQRELLVRLALRAGTAVPRERLIDELWGEEPPETAAHAVQVYVSQLRKALPESARIVTEGTAYRLEVDPESVDAARFERLLARARGSQDPREVASLLREAEVLWRGVPDLPLGDLDRARLEDLRVAALEVRVEAELALGRHNELVSELEAIVREHPLRERLRRHLMLALYRSGRQADAAAAYRDARRVLVEELGLEPSAELRELEAAILRQDASLVVEPSEVRERRRLPTSATPLVGRRREVDDLGGLIRGDARLVTLTGPGGTGKTRLALQVAHEASADFSDGTYFVGLAAVRDSELVLGEIAGALGVQKETGALEARLRDLEALVLIDNFEQVDQAAPELGALLAKAPRLRLLVTSRHPLRLYGEHEYPVPPLAEEEAVELFVARGRATGRSVAASEDVHELCARLDRLPLAIELVAARVRELGVREMLANLRRLDLATEGPRDVPVRHQTLRATIAGSVDLLREDGRRAFARIAVFAGGFDAAAAAAVCDIDGNVLETLVRACLLVEVDARFSMLETIREDALERLEMSGDEELVRRRHSAFFLELAERADAALAAAESQADWMTRLDTEHDNLRAALDWAAAQEDPVLELRLVMALGHFWEWRGHIREGAERFERAVARHGDRVDVLVGRALLRTSVLAYMRGDLARSEELAEAGVVVARATGDPELTANAVRRVGTLAKAQDDLVRARTMHEEALVLSRDAGDRRGVSSSLMNLADIALSEGRHADARRLAEDSVSLARELGDGMREVVALFNLALAFLHTGHADTAAAHFVEAALIARPLGYRDGVASSLEGLAAATAVGNPRAAVRLLGSADALLEETGTVLEPSELALHEQTVAALRERLAPRDYDEEWARGRALDLEAAVAEAEAVAGADRSR